MHLSNCGLKRFIINVALLNKYMTTHAIRYIFGILFMLFHFNIYSADIDSLRLVYENEEDVGKRIELLILLAEDYITVDKDTAINYATLALELSINEKLSDKEANALYILARCYDKNDDFFTAAELYEKALGAYQKLNDADKIAITFYRLGTTYKKRGLYKRAIEYCLASLRIYEKKSDLKGLARVYNCMGSIYKYQKEYEKALSYYNKSIDAKRKLHNDSVPINYNNLGIIYNLMGMNKLALEYYQKSLEIHKTDNYEIGIARLQTNIANLYVQEGEYEKAMDLYMQGLAIRERLGWKDGIENSYHNLGILHLKLKEYDMAESYLLKAHKLVKEMGLLESERSITENLYILYQEKGMYNDAFQHLLLHKQISDSVLNAEKTRQISQLELEYLEEKKQEKQLLQKQRTFYLRLVFYILLFFTLVIVILFLNKQKNKLNRHKLVQENLRLEKENMEAVLRSKSKELVSSALHLVQQSEANQIILQKLEQIKFDLKKQNQPLVQEIIYDLKIRTDMDIWDDFETRFLNVYEKFYDNLQSKFPELTNNEKRISAFLRLDLSTKEISAITKQSPHSINIARARLRKKLGLDNTDIKLGDFLSQF